FAWQELNALLSLSDAERRMPDDAGKAGLGDGFTVPLFVPGQRAASCSFATEIGQPLPFGALGMAKLVAHAAFEVPFDLRHPGGEASPPQLTPQQLQCVILARTAHSTVDMVNRALQALPISTYSQITSSMIR
ncbi:MAG: hypothetical protein EOO80_21720, partial [Oxalobacteraceae bacterium]